MKTLKSGLFSLLAIFAVSIFLTSCEQEQITDFTPQQQIEHKSQSNMILPFGIAVDSEETREEYIENATPELLDKMIENARVVYYLTSINKLEDAVTKMSYGGFFCDLDLTSFLTEGEIAGLQNYEIDTTIISNRCCYWTQVCKPPHGDCYWKLVCY